MHADGTDPPPLFIMGDSSGGGSALSALIAQASPAGLPGAGSARFSGGVFYSPWINLNSNGPTYQSNLFAKAAKGPYRLGDVAFGNAAIQAALQANQANARDYLGDARLSLEDPIANPLYADAQWLRNLPPISLHVGSAELLLSDSVMMAQRVAAAGRPVEIHQYDGRWRVFPMYADGAGSGEPLVLAQSAFSATNTFLAGVAARKPFKQSSTPFFYGHYEYPRGRDVAAGLSPFTDTP